MKNWKRFLAACLSVTMVASIPFTAFAETSVSVNELFPVEASDETNLERILSQEKPYEYFSNLKDQQEILDACNDEELFQLKEYMKYAYIYESDKENRQSLDAYLLISETWRSREVTSENQDSSLLENTKVYGTKFKDGDTEKTVTDFTTYMEYLQSIKTFDVPRYVEILSAFDEVKTEEDLAQAKENFSDFEDETFGFDEEKSTPEKTETSEKTSEKTEEKDNVKKSDDKKSEKTETSDDKKSEKTEESVSSEQEALKVNSKALNAGTWSNKEKYNRRAIRDRKVLAKKLGLLDQINEYSFLPNEYFADKSDAEIEAMPESALMDIASEEEMEDFLSRTSNSDERAAYDILKERIPISYTDGGGTHMTGLYKIYDTTAFCIQHSRTNPWPGNDGIYYSDPELNTNMNLRKVLYYGYGGPADIGWPAAKTAMAASVANGYDFGGSYGEAYLAEMAAKPAPPENFQVMVVHCQVDPPSGQKLQDLAFWKWSPNKVRIAYHPNGGTISSSSYKTNQYGWVTKNDDAYFHTISQGNSADPYNAASFGMTRKGYQFAGWKIEGTEKVLDQDTSYDSSVYTDYTNPKLNTSNTKLVTCYLRAVWKPNRVHITYNVQGGTIGNGYTVNKSGHVLSNDNLWFHYIDYGNSADPYNAVSFGMTKKGYRFGGWKVRSSGVILDEDEKYDSTVYAEYTNSKLNTSNTAEVWCYLDAVWIPNKVRIAYNPNGGTLESDDYTLNSSGYVMKKDNGDYYFHTVEYGKSARPYKASDFGITRPGYQFIGWKIYLTDKVLSQSTSYDSTVYTDRTDAKLNTSNTQLVTCYLHAEWKPITYTNSLHHWFYGLKNQEGNNGNKEAYNISDSRFDAAYGTTYVMGKDRAIAVPNGYHLDDYVGGSLLKWQTNKLGWEVTQAEKSFWFEYTYHPYEYNIFYNLNGGTNHSDNPDSYTILYGVTLKDPSKTGYIFTGWGSEQFSPNESDVTANAGFEFKDNTITVEHGKYDGIRLRVLNEEDERKVDVYEVERGTSQHYDTFYTHNLPTGNYTVCVDGKSGSDYTEGICFKNIYLTKGKTYHFASDIEFSGQQDTIQNMSIQPVSVTYTESSFEPEEVILPNPDNCEYTDKTAHFAKTYHSIRVKLLDDSMDPEEEASEWIYAGTFENKETGTSEKQSIVYTHNAPTGEYTLYLEGQETDSYEHSNGIGFTKMHFEQGKTYCFTTSLQVNSGNTFVKDIQIQNTKIAYEKTTGVNPGKGVPELSSKEVGQNFFYKELATRQTGNTGFIANWRPIKYTIVYDGNEETGGSTPSSEHTYNEVQPLTPNGFKKDGYRFDGWNTKKDGTGTSYRDKEEVKNLATKDGSVITLYAQWVSTDYNIIYKGNGATSGTEKEQEYSQSENGYTTQQNKGYTDFAKPNHTFVGWYSSSVVDTKEKMSKIYKQGNTLTLLELQKIHEEQLKKGIVKDTGSKAKDIVLYAVWDEVPSIDTSKMKKDQFYEGVDVTRAELLDGITANDQIDGSLTGQITITRIDYSAGKLVNGKKQEAYSKVWENGMPEDEKLDTWFMQLDKNDSPVTHTVTYQVKDSAGNVVTAKKEIKVIYNEFPEIRVTDFKFELEDAQSGKITKEMLLEKAIENGILSASDFEEGDMNSKIELLDYDADAFKIMKREGFIPITYKVQDSMGPNGKGKVTLKTVNVNINVRQKAKTVQYVRFINKKYYEKNADLDRDALKEQPKEIALLSVNGGLHPFSFWYTKPEYRQLITATFDKTTGTTYTYTKADVQEMRKFVKEHGVGNAKESDALTKFAEHFMNEDYIQK